MKKLLLSSAFLLTGLTSFSQDINFDIKNKKVAYFVSLEKKYKSVVFDDHQNYVSFNQDLAQPLIFRRTEKGIPDLLVYYTFSKTDSLIDHVLYEWDAENFEKGDVSKKPVAYGQSLIKKYNELLKITTAKFGESISKGDLSDLSKIEAEQGLQRTDDWKPNDTTEISLYTVVSNFYEKKGMVTTTPTHRIRLYIYNTEKKIDPKFDSNQLAKANSTFENFMAKLKADDFAGCKAFVNEKIATTATEQQLKTVKALLDFSKKTKVYMQGVQLGADGLAYLMLQYQYEDDKNEPPIDLIRVIFDKEGKIYGFSPVKRRAKD